MFQPQGLGPFGHFAGKFFFRTFQALGYDRAGTAQNATRRAIAPADPVQQQIFAWMPWVFMFMMSTFASGLIVYWITNNTITFIQQYLIMASHGSRPDFFGNIRAAKKKPVVVADKSKKK